jgi:hypothetical protein
MQYIKLLYNIFYVNINVIKCVLCVRVMRNVYIGGNEDDVSFTSIEERNYERRITIQQGPSVHVQGM